MDLSHVILGPVTTEKAERLKAGGRIHMMRVAGQATKIEVTQALERFYDVEVASVRVQNVGGKSRDLRPGVAMEKRHPYKKAIVTLTTDSRQLDLSSFRNA